MHHSNPEKGKKVGGNIRIFARYPCKKLFWDTSGGENGEAEAITPK
jgi:hypothetical protein